MWKGILSQVVVTLLGIRLKSAPSQAASSWSIGGKIGEVTGLYEKFGQVVGYEILVEGHRLRASLKDVYIDREYLEDIQPPTAGSVGIATALSHWATPRNYWHDQTDGVEALCFDLASATPKAKISPHDGGWKFLIPSLMPNDRVVVNCAAPLHGKFWSLGLITYPERQPLEDLPLLDGHWQRVFTWTYEISRLMRAQGYPWDPEAVALRAEASALILKPLVQEIFEKCLAAKRSLGYSGTLPPGFVDAAFSKVRLPTGTVGLTEPPTDQRPYTVLSISPEAARSRDYLEQVVLHECIHIVCASEGGDPHNEEFIQLSKLLGLEEKHRD